VSGIALNTYRCEYGTLNSMFAIMVITFSILHVQHQRPHIHIIFMAGVHYLQLAGCFDNYGVRSESIIGPCLRMCHRPSAHTHQHVTVPIQNIHLRKPIVGSWS